MNKSWSLLGLLFLCLWSCSSNHEEPSIKPYTSPSDLDGARVAVVTGTTHDNYVTKHHPNAQIVRVEQIPEVLVAIETGKADFALIDFAILEPVMKARPHFTVVDENIFTDGIGIGFLRENAPLCQRFNSYLKEIKSNGIYDEIYHRWIENPDCARMPSFNLPESGQKIVIGTNSASFPFVFMQENQVVGFDIELFNRFAEQEQLNIEYLDMNFGGLISALVSKKIDVIAASMCITEERSKQVLFSDSYFDCVSVVVAVDKSKKSAAVNHNSNRMPQVIASDPQKGATMADSIRAIVGNRNVSVVEGSIQEIFMSNTLPAGQVSVVKDHPDAVLMVKSGNAAFTCCNIGNATYDVSRDTTLSLFFEGILPTPCCFGVSKQNPELKRELDRFITAANESGELQAIHQRWFTELDGGEMSSFDFSTAKGTLRVGSGCASIPYSFLSEKGHRGIDIEILTRFAHATGRKIEVVELPFGSLVASLLSNRVDVIANNLSPTEDRLKSIDFTLPYDRIQSVLLTKKHDHPAEPRDGWFRSLKESVSNNLIVENRYLLILNGLKETLIISILSLLLGTLFGGVICYLRMSSSPLWSLIGRAYIDLMRGLPVLVLLMITYYVVFADSQLSATSVAVFTFALNFGAYVSEMFRSAIAGIDKGQREAGIAMGFTPLQTFVLIIAPQAIARVLPVYKGEAISLVKMTSIVGYIAVQDLTKASDIIRSRTFDAFFPLLLVALIYFVLSWLFTLLLDLLTSQMIRKS